MDAANAKAAEQAKAKEEAAAKAKAKEEAAAKAMNMDVIEEEDNEDVRDTFKGDNLDTSELDKPSALAQSQKQTSASPVVS